jgi:ABC-2 type transport system permease protein
MSITRTFTMVARDLRLGPRSPIIMGVIVVPLVMTFMMQVVYLRVLSPAFGRPRLAIADLGNSQVTAQLERMDTISVTRARDAEGVERLVRSFDADAGLVLPEGFDEAVRAGARPRLGVHVAGESLMSNRILLAVTTIDLIRDVEDGTAPVDVVLHTIGDREALPIAQILVLFMSVFVLILLGMFVPAFMLVQERSTGTLGAVLVTPATMSDVLAAKALLGVMMAVPMALLTLILNGAMPAQTLGVTATLVVAGAMCVEIGLLYGTVAKDAETLFTLMKTLNIIILLPMVFYVFPDWPRWIGPVFPTFWFIDPLYRIALEGATFADVWTDLAIACVIVAVLALPVALLGRRMAAKLAAA